jgi:two-component system nitrogen regulation response regulator GlnG
MTRLGESMGHDVVAAASAEQALDEAQRCRPDVVVLDVRLPGMDGLTALERLQQLCGSVPVIVITAYGDLRTAVEAVRRGAFDYIAKPFDAAQVKGAVVRALASRAGAATEPLSPDDRPVEGMVGRSPAMQQVYKQIALAASSGSSVLVTGESGTGKELAARAIHRYSPRADGPFVAVNVASLSPLLAESELFGHVRGAFTGAEVAREGLLARACGGTLFLDEVADIPLPTQVKLLRALEHGEVLPVGSNEPVRTDFRVVSATHRDLAASVEQSSFRHDLYFRLCAFQIQLPPLRERPQDLAELACYFARTQAGGGTPAATISAEAIAALERRPWRGNVRELRNAIDHALIMARGRPILPEHLPPLTTWTSSSSGGDVLEERVAAAVRNWVADRINDPQLDGRVYDRLLELVEPPLVEAALRRYNSQCAAAARKLGMHRTTLRKKATEYQSKNPPLAEH